jgi:glycosyltransferase involved in cell wall biosynthesis
VKVLFLASDPALGPDVPFGDSIRVRLLIEALRELGHDVEVRWAGPAAPPGRVGQPRQSRVPIWARQLVRDARDLAQARSFRRSLGNVGRPDLVFEFAAYLADVGVPVSRRLSVPYVVEIEGPLAELRYERGARGLRWHGDVIERRRLAAADRVVTVSETYARRVIEDGGPAQGTIAVPNVADAARFQPNPARRDEMRARLGISDRLIVGFHGVFSPWYGLDALVEAFALVEAQDAFLLLVGDGVDREAVERLVAERGLADRVLITGFVSHDEVPGYLDALDIAVIPDHVWWTSPLKLFEYGAMRKPVIAARAISVESMAAGGEFVLVEPRSPIEIAREIDRLAGDAAHRDELAARWSARVAESHGHRQFVQQIGAVLEAATG